MKWGFILFISLILTTVKSQNLVQNPSFEDTIACPTSLSVVSNAAGWSSFSGTPDYFNSCGTSGVSTPSNLEGYQVPHTGNAYAGIITFNKAGFWREIIGSKLSSSLVIGQKYYVWFYANLTIKPPNNTFATNKMGAKFTMTAYSYSPPNPISINNTAQLHYDTMLTDTTNWKLISGSFIADSAYQYIAIGNFFDDLHMDTTRLGNGAIPILAYYYIDDVSVSTDSTGEDINEINLDNYFSVYSNPSSGIFKISSAKQISCIIIYNMIGEKIYSEKVNSNNSEIDLSKKQNGFYFIHILCREGTAVKKIILNK